MDSHIPTADERQELLDRLAEDRAEIAQAFPPLDPPAPRPLTQGLGRVTRDREPA